MRPVLLGAGKMGSVAARFLLDIPSVEQVIVADADPKRLQAVLQKHGARVTAAEIDLTDHRALVAVMRSGSIVASTAPLALNLLVTEAAIEARRDLIDLSGGDTEKRLEAHELVKAAGITVLPGCGVAPGLSNILAGNSAAQLDTVDDIVIRVGGFPESPKPPLGYSVSWSMEAVIDEYTSSVHILRDGQIVEVPPLSGQEKVYFDGIGELEGFLTEGLSTLAHSMRGRGVKNVEERTLRYPGHIDRIRTLYECGMFDKEPVEIRGHRVSPLEVSTAALERKLHVEDDPDIIAMRVTVTGTKDGRRAEVVSEMIDRYDRGTGISAMARTTTLPLVIVLELVAAGKLKDKGVIPTEICIGQSPELFRLLLEGLERHGVMIRRLPQTWPG